MSLIRKHGAVLQAWACLDLVCSCICPNAYDYRCNLILQRLNIHRLILDGRYQALSKMHQPFYTPWYSILFVQLYVLYATILVRYLIVAIFISMNGCISQHIFMNAFEFMCLILLLSFISPIYNTHISFN